MMNSESSPCPFVVKTCSLAAIATGEHVNSLIDLRDKLAKVDEACIYYHFWGEKMNPHFVHSQHHNDFASWVFHRLHDNVLAEKLGIIDPTEFESLEFLRQEIIETIENRLDEQLSIHLTNKENAFHFIRSIIIVFESSLTIPAPSDLPKIIPLLPPSSIFYHFIDARSRTQEKINDFSVWLKMFGNEYKPLIETIKSIDPYFLSLTKLREELTRVTQQFFDKGSHHV